MVYFDTEKVVSQFISIFKEKFKYNNDCFKLDPLYAKYPNFNEISLLSIEEDIALWSLPYFYRFSGKNYKFYFYSDLNGKLLFDGEFFNYATAFSGGCALVSDDENNWSVINLNTKEIMPLPADLGWMYLTDFRNNSLAVYDGEIKKWGAYTLDCSEHSWHLDIPFIWDFLSLSRDPNLVYVGLDYPFYSYPNLESEPYNHMVPDRHKSDESGAYKVAALQKDEVKNLDAFKEMEKCMGDHDWANTFRTRYLLNCQRDVGDEHFHESPNNTGSIVDCGSLNDYVMVLSKLKK